MSKTSTAEQECVGCGELVSRMPSGTAPVCPKCSGAERARKKAERRQARQTPAAGEGSREAITPPMPVGIRVEVPVVQDVAAVEATYDAADVAAGLEA